MLTGPTPEAEEEYGRACEDYETNVAILLEMLRRDLTDGQAWRPAWRPISSVPEHKTVLLYRKPDLYPIVGSSMGDDFILEEGGPEDDEERQYPFLRYKPTHWAELPETPL